MSNVIDFNRAKDEKNRKDKKSEKMRVRLWLQKTALSLKNNLFMLSKSCCWFFLVFVSALSRKLLKLVCTLSIVLFIIEWFMGRLGAQEFNNLLFLIALTLVVNVVSTSCIRWIRGSV